MRNLLKTIDLFGSTDFFNYKGKERFKTVWGGIMSILLLIATLAAAGYYIYTLVSKDNPKIFYQLYKGFNEKTFVKEKDINEGIFPFFTKISYQDQSLLDFSNLQVNLYYVRNKNQSAIFNIEGKECHLKDFPTYAQEYLKEKTVDFFPINSEKTDFVFENYEKLFCFDIRNKTFSDFFNSDLANYYIVVRYKENNPELINIKPNLIANFYSLYSDYDLTHYEDIYYRYLKFLGGISIQNSKFESHFIKFIKLIIDTDVGWVSDNTESTKSYMISDRLFIGSFDNEENSYVLRYEIALDEYAHYYKRTYMKVQDCLSFIGGLQSQIHILLFMVSGFISKVKIKEDLINAIFDFEKIEKNKPNCIIEINPGQTHPHKNEIIQDEMPIIVEMKLHEEDDSARKIKYNYTYDATKTKQTPQLNKENTIKLPAKKAHTIPTSKIKSKLVYHPSLSETICLAFTPCCLSKNRTGIIYKELVPIVDHYLDISKMLKHFITIEEYQVKQIGKIAKYKEKTKYCYNEGYNIEDYVKQLANI